MFSKMELQVSVSQKQFLSASEDNILFTDCNLNLFLSEVLCCKGW